MTSQSQLNGREASALKKSVCQFTTPGLVSVREGNKQRFSTNATDRRPGVVNQELETMRLTPPARSVVEI
jgi:hypothetical protein